MSDPRTLDAPTLCHRCKQESIKYRARFANDPRFCLELWRRALHEKIAGVWEVLTHCYTPSVRGWLYKHRLALLALRYQPNENYFLDETFTRIWLANHTKPIRVESLPKIITYAKKTLDTVILEACRPTRTVPLPDPGTHDPPSAPVPRAPEIEAEVQERLDAPELWERISSCTTSEREQLVIELIAFSGWKPRRICQEFPQDFPDVKEIYRILDNFRARYTRRYRTCK